MEKLSLYIHIPFCIKKCRYCDFLSGPCDADTKERYVSALIREIRQSEYAGSRVETVFFGGGTPTTLKPELLKEILDNVRDIFTLNEDAEISIECNPGTVDKEKLVSLRQMGFNRLSIGLQSTDDDELKYLGRIHNYEEFLETYKNAREVGFENINVDIMSALPGQTIDSYKDTLKKVISLGPEHISAYSLIIEEGTEFWDIYGDDGNTLTETEPAEGVLPLPDEDTERDMYYLTKKVLEEAGYHRYEISNYAKDGFECRHNKVYWTGDPYIGFGIGAASYADGVRWSNTDELYPYMKLLLKEENMVFTYDDEEDEAAEEDRPLQTAWRQGYQRLSPNDKMEEFMIVGLRLMKGVSKERFAALFGRDIDRVFGSQIKKNEEAGLLETDGDNIRLTEAGIDVSNRVLASFLL